jgi:hypothetical protein
MTVYRRDRPLRDYLIDSDEAARLIHVTKRKLRSLSAAGFIKPGKRSGFYRLGDVVDGHAEAVRMAALPAPHARTRATAHFECEIAGQAEPA